MSALEIDPFSELLRLCDALDVRSREVRDAENWFNGDHPIPTPPASTAAAAGEREALEAFRVMSRLAVTNMIPPIVREPAKKLRIEGFQFGETPTSTDQDAWRIYQRNCLDADAPLAFTAAVKTGQSFALVWMDSDGLAEITMEDPSQCIVAYAAGSRRRRRSALKRWIDEDGYTCATLYLPNEIYKFRSQATAATSVGMSVVNPPAVEHPASGGWTRRIVDGEAWPLRNSFGEVPMVELAVNPTLKPRLFGGGTPQFTGILNEQRKINATVMNLLITMDNQAFRQRWTSGWDYPLDDAGKPDKAAILKASAARMWTLQGEDVKVGEFSQADFRPFIDVLTYFTKVISFGSSTPPHAFLLGEMINVAADSLARLDSSHIAEVRAIADGLGEGMEEVMRLALKAENNPKAADTSTSVRWAEFEQRTATEQMQVATDMKTLGAPMESVFAAVPGVTQQEAQRWTRQAGGASILAAVLGGADASPAPSPPDMPGRPDAPTAP